VHREGRPAPPGQAGRYVPGVLDTHEINWSAFVAALPAVGAFVQVIGQSVGFGGERRLKRHMELLASAPNTVDSSTLQALVEYETALLAQRTHRRLSRKIDWATLATMIFVLAVAALIVLGLWSLSNKEWPSWLTMSFRVVAILVGGFGFLLAAVGSAQFWKDDDGDTESHAEE
jgi:hypothetical protein